MWRAAVAGLVYFTLGVPVLLRAADPPPNPDQQCRAAAKWLATSPEERGASKADEAYIRFVTWYGVPAERREATRTLFAWWCNQLSFAPAASVPRDVPGSDGLLQWLDLRWYRWNAEAWAAVAEREPYTQEPWVFRDAADALRSVIGYHVPERLAKRDVYPVVALVRGDWLLRETLESNRSTSYYDLLFAERRFTKGEGGKKVARTVDHPGGDFRWPDGRVSRNVKPGRYTVEYDEPGEAKVVDFPKTKKDWDKAFGADVVRKFGKDADVLTSRGAVVEGARSNPKAGSIVALNDRIVVLDLTPYGSMTTLDFLHTDGRRDPVELAPKLPKLVADDEVGEDGGEALSYLPNGGQAGFLFDAKGNRVEIANPQLAGNQADPRLNPGVRNPGDCIRCHAPSGGFNIPRNLVELAAEKGVDVKFKDPEDATLFRGFFSKWEKRAKAFSEPYNDLVAETTKLQPPTAAEFEYALKSKDDAKLKALADRVAASKLDKGWTGAVVAKETAAFLAGYDDPLDPDRVAAELGCPKEAAVAVAVKSPGGRAAYLARGLDTPRSVFENDLFRELSLRLTAGREPRKEK